MRSVRGGASKKLVVVVGQPGHRQEAWRAHRARGAGEPNWDVIHIPIEPPCDPASLHFAAAVVVDGGCDLALAVAECARLGVLGVPIIVVCGEPLSTSVLERAGIAEMLSIDASLQDVEDSVSSLLGAGRRDSAVVLAADALVALNARVHLDRAKRVFVVDGREVAPSAQKFELLCYFVERAGVAIGAPELVKCGLLRPGQAPRLKGLVQELRARLGPARDLISAVPGYGYRFDLAAESGRDTIAVKGRP